MEADIQSLIEKEKKYLFNTYRRLNILIESGEGCYLYSKSGRKILDMFAGLAVNVLGYAHPKINEAITSQIHKYIHISNFFYQESQINLAEKLINSTGFAKVFFSNSGTEAVEGSIKIVRKYFQERKKKTLISFSGSYHGRSYGALSLTSRTKYREGYEPFLPDILHLKYNSTEDLEKYVNDDTAAIFVECIQGEGGINLASAEFVNRIKDLRNKFGFLLVADEIQSGVGRTGKLHSYEHFDIVPDILVIAKGIGGGLPLGALLGNIKVADIFQVGVHGSTFGGNPVAASCGLVVFDELHSGLMDKVKQKGQYLKSKLFELKNKYSDKIKDVRGIGLMVGIELYLDGQNIVDRLLEQNVLVNCTNGNVIRLLPPLIIEPDEIDLFIDKLKLVFGQLR
ncbi:MAG: aspartate aminotransferase family protein [Ignavibacteria bacterium]